MIKKSLYVICTASILSASVTMCYKKDHVDPSTIETITLSGGECNDKLSVNDMKKNGYQVDSMKIQNGTNGFNYIYVFQKETVKKQMQAVVPIVSGLSDADLTARIENIQKKKIEKKEKEEMISSIDSAKKIYESTCKRCHGDGSISAYNLAEPLNNLSLEDMKMAISDYGNGTKDNGMAMLMQPYASLVTDKDVEGIYNYLKTLK